MWQSQERFIQPRKSLVIRHKTLLPLVPPQQTIFERFRKIILYELTIYCFGFWSIIVNIYFVHFPKSFEGFMTPISVDSYKYFWSTIILHLLSLPHRLPWTLKTFVSLGFFGRPWVRPVVHGLSCCRLWLSKP